MGHGRISRRSLLRAVPAVLAAPYVLRTMRGAAGKEKLPSDRVTIGMIGCGRSGSNWAGNYWRLRQFQFLWACDVDDEHSGRMASRLGRRDTAPKLTRDFRNVLADDRVDAVVIATPDHWHGVIACAAARAGKDIYCENPVALTVREAGQIASVAKRWGRVFQVALHHRYYASYRRACELVRGGVLGTIKQIHAPSGGVSQFSALGGSGTCPDTLDWDLWLGPAPWAPYNKTRCSYSYDGWRNFREYCGGSLTSHGCGVFDIIGWMLGRDGEAPVEFVPPRREGEDDIPLTVRYADGLTILGSRGPNKGSIEFVGDKGSLALGVGDKGFTTFPNELDSATVPKLTEPRAFSSDSIRDFRDCVRTRALPLAGAETAREATTTAHLACIAHWTDRTIRWDPAGGKIVDDAFASRLLSRPMRMPWRC